MGVLRASGEVEMKLRQGCNAAWYELNISSADDCVSACCYYAGAKDRWKDDVPPLDEYWNSPNFQRIRQINSSDGELSGGCAGCYFFGHRGEAGLYFPEFLKPFDDLTIEQRANWLRAIDDYKNGRQRVTCTPLRFYVNFGFACNLSCTMCHQVPRRKQERRQVSAEILRTWKPQFRAALDLTVIGGEPFVLTQARRFIKEVIDDEELENVQLTICTNGTLLHKHWETLARKRKLMVTVSLDTIGREFEKIRVGADWAQVERNILEFQDLGRRLKFSWRVQSPCMLLRTNVPRLYDFAEWAIAHGVEPGFYDFINARGIERTFETDNVVADPDLLKDLPNWEKCFESTIDLLRASPYELAAGQLVGLYRRILEKVEERKSFEARLTSLRSGSQWRALLDFHRDELPQKLAKNTYGKEGARPVLDLSSTGLVFRPTDLKDHLSTPFLLLAPARQGSERLLRARCEWLPTGVEIDRPRCRFFLQDETCRTLNELATETPMTGQTGLNRYYMVEEGVKRVRLVICAEGTTSSVMPDRVMVECDMARTMSGGIRSIGERAAATSTKLLSRIFILRGERIRP
jgi:hypothetical protein